MLRQVGGGGQVKLKAARVVVIGAGGLGSPCLLYLAAAGVGHIRIIDNDVLALSNLQRQVLFSTTDVGAPKADAAATHLSALNPHVLLDPVPARLTPANATALLTGHDLVADGSDSFATRGAVADAAYALRLPLVTAAIGPWEGQLGTFRGWQIDQPCWRCFADQARDREGDSCADTGVIGALAGVIGAMQALEVIRQIVGFGTGLDGRLLLWDALSLRSRTIAVAKNPACPLCSVASPRAA